jgi:UDP-N-acetylmuramate dehydrogenase
MNADPIAVLEAAFPGLVRRNHPLAPYSAFKVGGSAECFIEPSGTDEVGEILRRAHAAGIPVFALGGGTNLLIRDGGIRGVVIHMGRPFRQVTVSGRTLTAGSVTPMGKAALAAEQAGLAGLEFGFDIPGTVGGALRMNAGAHGSEIKDVLLEARGFDPTGVFRAVPAAQIRFAYRTAVYPTEMIFTEADFGLRPGDSAELAARREANHAYRLRTQPKGRTAGSVFKNPEGDYAGRLVEAVGLKGCRVGGAVVSDKHANWILNDRDATAKDIETLILTIQRTVKDRFGITLTPEVRIVGEELVETS